MAGERIIGFKINIKGSEEVVKTIGELEQIVKDTNKALKEAEVGSKEYEQLNAQLAGAKEQLIGVRKEQRLQIKEAEGIRSATGSYRELNAELVVARNRFKELSRVDREGDVGKELTLNIQRLDAELKELDTTIGQSQRNVGNYASAFEGLNVVIGGSISDIATLAFGAGGIAALGALLDSTVGSVKDLADEFFILRGQVEQLTGASGEELDTFTSRISAIAETFGVETDEILLSANTLTEQLSGDFTESLNAIEAGFLSGADANGELLDSIKEYSGEIKSAGLNTSELLSIISTSTDQGVFSDKGIDAVSEFSLRIKESTDTTRDALLGAFGSDFTDALLDGINTGSVSVGEALKSVSAEIGKTEIPVARLQTLITDVFGEAGEKAGLPFIESLKDISSNTSELSGLQTEYALTQKSVLDLNAELAKQSNELSKELSGVSGNFDLLVIRGKVFFTEVLVSGVRVLKGIGGAIAAVGKFLSQNLELVILAAAAYGIYNQAIILTTLNKVKLRAATIAENATLAIGNALYAVATFGVSAYSTVIGVLTSRTKAVAAATALWNLVLSLNPIGAIIAVVSGLVIGLIALEKRFGFVTKALNIFRRDSTKLEQEEKKRSEEREKRESAADLKDKQRNDNASRRRRDSITAGRKAAEEVRKQEEQSIADREAREKEQAKNSKKRTEDAIKESAKFAEAVRKDEEQLNEELRKENEQSIKDREEAIDKKLQLERDATEERLQLEKDLAQSFRVLDDEELDEEEKSAKKTSEILQRSGDLQTKQARTNADRKLAGDELTAAERITLEKELVKELLAIQIKALEESLKLDGLSIEDELALESKLIAAKRTLKEAEIEEDKVRREELQELVTSSALQTIDIIAQFDEARRNNQISRAEEQARIDIELANGNAATIEKINKDLADKKDKIDKDFRKREQKRAIASALINGAVAVTKILAEVPKGDFGIATAILIGLAVAQTAAEVAVIGSQKFARGGLLNGASHAAGGVPVRVGGARIVEAEGGEAIINKRSTSRFLPLLSSINEAGGGVPLMQGGGLLGDISLPSLGSISTESESTVLGLINEVRNEVKAAQSLALAVRSTQLTQKVVLDTEELDSVQTSRIELDALRTL